MKFAPHEISRVPRDISLGIADFGLWIWPARSRRGVGGRWRRWGAVVNPQSEIRNPKSRRAAPAFRWERPSGVWRCLPGTLPAHPCHRAGSLRANFGLPILDFRFTKASGGGGRGIHNPKSPIQNPEGPPLPCGGNGPLVCGGVCREPCLRILITGRGAWPLRVGFSPGSGPGFGLAPVGRDKQQARTTARCRALRRRGLSGRAALRRLTTGTTLPPHRSPGLAAPLVVAALPGP